MVWWKPVAGVQETEHHMYRYLIEVPLLPFAKVCPVRAKSCRPHPQTWSFISHVSICLQALYISTPCSAGYIQQLKSFLSFSRTLGFLHVLSGLDAGLFESDKAPSICPRSNLTQSKAKLRNPRHRPSPPYLSPQIHTINPKDTINPLTKSTTHPRLPHDHFRTSQHRAKG